MNILIKHQLYKSKNTMQATVLSIAGSDPTGGAGIQADLKTMTAIGVYGAAAITCVTVQNSHGVAGIECLAPDLVRRQIQIVLDDHFVTHIKIGMVGSLAIADAIRSALETFQGEVIYDPVMLATTGQPLMEGDLNELFDLLVPQCTVLTPNIPELAYMAKAAVTTQQDAVDRAGKLLDKHSKLRAVLVKGGHAIQDEAIVDALVYRSGDTVQTTSIPHPRIQTLNAHGTGCTLASAFASFHCLEGNDIRAFQQSVEHVQTLLKNSASITIVKNPEGRGGMLHYTYRP